MYFLYIYQITLLKVTYNYDGTQCFKQLRVKDLSQGPNSGNKMVVKLEALLV